MSGRARDRSKLITDADNGRSRCRHRWFFPVIDELSLIFRRNCAAEISYRAGRSIRICEVWLSKKSAPDGAALAALLNSDIGDRLWLALTRSSPHPWRRKLNRQIEISRLRDQQRETQARLEALERGEI